MEENWSPGQENRGGVTMVSPEIVEIGDDGRSVNSSNGRDFTTANDVYVAVGKDDLDVLKWALGHCVPPGSRIFLVHIFPPITYINTPVGRLSRNQLNQDQVRVYINEENNRRRNTLQKYIRLCADAKLNVDTLLIEHKSVTKAILALIPVLNITKLVIGVKRSPYPRLIAKKPVKGELVRKNAPDYCEVIVVYDGQKNAAFEKPLEPSNPLKPSALLARGGSDLIEKKFFDLGCFSGQIPERRNKVRALGMKWQLGWETGSRETSSNGRETGEGNHPSKSSDEPHDKAIRRE